MQKFQFECTDEISNSYQFVCDLRNKTSVINLSPFTFNIKMLATCAPFDTIFYLVSIQMNFMNVCLIHCDDDLLRNIFADVVLIWLHGSWIPIQVQNSIHVKYSEYVIHTSVHGTLFQMDFLSVWLCAIPTIFNPNKNS